MTTTAAPVRGRPRKLSPDDEARLVRYYQRGEPIAELCGRYELSHVGVRLVVKRHGVTLRPRGRQPVTYFAPPSFAMALPEYKCVCEFDIYGNPMAPQIEE